MKTLKPNENPAKLAFWVKWIAPLLIIVIGVSAISKIISYKKETEERALDKAMRVDTVMLNQLAVGITVYEIIAEKNGIEKLSSLGDFNRIEKALQKQNILMKDVSPILGSRIEIFGDFDFIGYKSKNKEVCYAYNLKYQEKEGLIKENDVKSIYKNIKNKSKPLCVTLSNSKKMVGGDYIVLSIKDQKPNNSMKIY